jgi:hypothetical protein
MSGISEDYDSLRQLRFDERAAWIRHRLPNGASTQWWLAMTERANQDDEFVFGSEIIHLGVELGQVPAHHAVVQLARFAIRSASATDTCTDSVPTPDDVARKFLSSTQLTPEESIEAATRRRREILTNPDAVIRRNQDTPQSNLPDDLQIDRLAELEEMVSAIEPLLAHIRDQGLSRDVRTWLEVRKKWEIGEEAASTARRRLLE